jgi:hypothetical protein
MLFVLHHPGMEYGRLSSDPMKRIVLVTSVALAAGLASCLAATLPSVQIARESTNLLLTFRGQLQHSSQVQGPYTTTHFSFW